MVTCPAVGRSVGRLIGLIGVIRKFAIKPIKIRVFIGIYRYFYVKKDDYHFSTK